MKTLKSIILGMFMVVVATAFGQVSLNVNVGTPPSWDPAGYSSARYYYLPEIEVYYDVQQANYIYLGNGKWYRSNHLPNRCKHYDLHRGHKVVHTNYHGSSPYSFYHNHKVKYPKNYKGNGHNSTAHNDNHQYKSKQYKGKSHSNGNDNSNNKGGKNHSKGKKN